MVGFILFLEKVITRRDGIPAFDLMLLVLFEKEVLGW
jgi:hypothetical protein